MVCGFKDGLGGAIVLLQEQDLDIGIILLEVKNMAQVSVPPGVDRLIRVSDYADITILPR